MQPDAPLASEDTPLFDTRRARHYVTFVRGSLRRHKRLVAIVCLAVIAGTMAVLWSLPKTYRVEAKVLAHGNAALAVRADSAASNEAPTRTAAETILRRDALVALIQQNDLIRHYHEHRAPAQRARDAINQLFSSQAETEEDRMDAMVELLEKKLSVWTNDGGSTVSIAIEWPDPKMAVRIIDSAQQNYLESRYAQEVTALAESIGILQSHVESSRAEVDDAVAALQKVRAEKEARARPPDGAAVSRPRPVAPAPLPSPAPVPSPVGQGADPALAQLKASLDAKQRAVADLEDFRSRRLLELQGRLAEQQMIYTENHPAIVDLKQAIAAVSAESPQVKSLRSEIATLKGEYARHTGAASPDTAGPAPGTPARSRAPGPFVAMSSMIPELPADVIRLDLEFREEERDPNVTYARGQLHDAMDKYAALRTHIQTSEIDLETAKAAFKYRYSVVTPAHVPKHPLKPKPLLVAIASVMAGLFAGAFLAVIADLRGGLLVERMQLERLLDRPILAEVDLPRLPPPDSE